MSIIAIANMFVSNKGFVIKKQEGIMKKSMLLVTATLLGLTLAGCGGGGGGSTTATNLDPANPGGVAPTATPGPTPNPGGSTPTPGPTATPGPPDYSTAGIAKMSIAEVQAIPPAVVATMSADQLIAMGSISAFNADQTAAMSYDQLAASGLAYLGITRKPTITINSATLTPPTYMVGGPFGLLGRVSISYDLGGVANTPDSASGNIRSYVIISNTPTTITATTRLAYADAFVPAGTIGSINFSKALVVDQAVPFTTQPFSVPSGFNYNAPAYIIAVACVDDLSYIQPPYVMGAVVTVPQICSQASTPITIIQ
jgi:hypothetical protein